MSRSVGIETPTVSKTENGHTEAEKSHHLFTLEKDAISSNGRYSSTLVRQGSSDNVADIVDYGCGCGRDTQS